MFIRNLLLCIVLGLMFSYTLINPNMPATTTTIEEDTRECEELPLDLWIRISNEEETLGRIMYLDMSRGWSGTDGAYIYLYVIDVVTGEPIAMAFPMNDYFEMDYSIFSKPPPEPKKEEKEEEFDMEEYLKKTKGQGIEIKKVANSS